MVGRAGRLNGSKGSVSVAVGSTVGQRVGVDDGTTGVRVGFGVLVGFLVLVGSGMKVGVRVLVIVADGRGVLVARGPLWASTGARMAMVRTQTTRIDKTSRRDWKVFIGFSF